MGILRHYKSSSHSSSSSSEGSSAAASLTVVRGGETTNKLLMDALHKRSFIDQIITCGGPGNERKFYVHKLVLSVHSRFFAERHNDDVVKLGEDVTPDAMAAIIGLLYEGKAEVDDVTKVPELRAAAEKLQMSDLLASAGMAFQFDDRNFRRLTGVRLLDATRDSGNGTEATASQEEENEEPLTKFRKRGPQKRAKKQQASPSPRLMPAVKEESAGAADMDINNFLTVEMTEPTNRPSFAAAVATIIRCDICRETFETTEMRDDHNALLHGGNAETQTEPRAAQTPEPRAKTAKEEKKPGASDLSSDHRYMCGQCPVSFGTIKLLKHHAVTHTRAISKQHSCGVCGEKFRFVQQLNIHLVRAHTDGVRVLDRPSEGNHKAASAAVVDKSSILCEECNKTFATSVRLQLHRNKFHGDWANGARTLLVKQKLKYEECDATFKTKLGLDKHNCKKAPALLPCPHCDLRFGKDSYLQNHLDEEHAFEEADVAEKDFVEQVQFDD
jgi:hypothetical protein